MPGGEKHRNIELVGHLSVPLSESEFFVLAYPGRLRSCSFPILVRGCVVIVRYGQILARRERIFVMYCVHMFVNK